MKWHVKIHKKNCRWIREKRTQIFPPFGVPLCALDLQNAAFGRQARSKETLKK